MSSFTFAIWQQQMVLKAWYQIKITYYTTSTYANLNYHKPTSSSVSLATNPFENTQDINLYNILRAWVYGNIHRNQYYQGRERKTTVDIGCQHSVILICTWITYVYYDHSALRWRDYMTGWIKKHIQNTVKSSINHIVIKYQYSYIPDQQGWRDTRQQSIANQH
jgi:hypothetical protein